MADNLTKKQRSYCMSRIKSKNTKVEVTLASLLRKQNIKFTRQNKRILGKPDFILKDFNIAIFCDSEFFHGKNWEKQKKSIKTNRKYWLEKIERNIKRDKLVNKKLRQDGWKVLRFWAKELIDKPDKAIKKINEAVRVKNEKKGQL
ncbi:MAG: very short patch repair endonuclease [Candidatus Goldbacteria bacterium]|nr:very short patch repair endonuclease [Candidatus Goldiibacteriota bacterium]